MNKLLDKIMVISDNNSSVCQKIAQLAREEGATVLCIYDHNHSSILANLPYISASFKYDSTSLKSYQKVVQAIVKDYHKIDIWVSLGEFISPDMLLSSTNNHLLSVQKKEASRIRYSLKTLLPIMSKNNGGSFINVSSIDELKPSKITPYYLSAQQKLADLLKNNALKYTKNKIRINTVCPSTIKIPLITFQVSKKITQYKTAVSFPYFGKTDDIASAVLYLSCDEASFITGSKLIIDGGKMV